MVCLVYCYTCSSFFGHRIGHRQEAYWSINYVKVFAPEPATKSQAKSEKTATKTQTQSAKEKVVRKGEKMEEIKKLGPC